jgi:hypothetical protein
LDWRWTARRLVISAFVLFHVAALSIWTMPPCAFKDRYLEPFRYYVLPLGLWQWWSVFAPEPLRENRVLEAEVIDAKRLIHVFEFTKIGDLPWYEKMVRYRNPKFTDNMLSGGEYNQQRVFTARHVVRQLGLGEDSFPVTVSLYVKVNDCPPAGTPTADPMIPPRIHMIDRYQFASLKEVRP